MFTAQPVEVFNYYAYGMLIPGFFSNASPDYRFGFNGMLRDDDVRDEKLTSDNEGRGNSYSTEYRFYDNRVGRWLSIDPLASKFPWSSPYVAMGNNPVIMVDPDGRAGQVITAAVGAAIGGGLEYASQVMDNFSKPSTDKNLFDRAWNAMVRDIDGTDVLISTGAGAITGATLGLSSLITIPLNVGLSVGEDFSKSKLGTKKSNYESRDVLISIGGSVTGDIAGNYIKKGMQMKPKANQLYKDSEKKMKLASQRNRTEQFNKANKAKNKAKSYGDLESLVGGESAERVASETVNKLKKK